MDILSFVLAKKYTDKAIQEAGVIGFEAVIVEELPETGSPNKMYLLPRESDAEANVYDEYIYTNHAWEKIGSTDVDLTDYWNTQKAQPETWTFTLADGTTVTKKVLLDVRS